MLTKVLERTKTLKVKSLTFDKRAFSEDDTILNYKCSDYYDAKSEANLLWNDPDLSIDWGVLDPILAVFTLSFTISVLGS